MVVEELPLPFIQQQTQIVMEQMIVAIMVLPNPTIVPQTQGRSIVDMEGMSSKEFQVFVG
jgi:hypothetical protein